MSFSDNISRLEVGADSVTGGGGAQAELAAQNELLLTPEILDVDQARAEALANAMPNNITPNPALAANASDAHYQEKPRAEAPAISELTVACHAGPVIMAYRSAVINRGHL